MATLNSIFVSKIKEEDLILFFEMGLMSHLKEWYKKYNEYNAHCIIASKSTGKLNRRQKDALTWLKNHVNPTLPYQWEGFKMEVNVNYIHYLMGPWKALYIKIVDIEDIYYLKVPVALLELNFKELLSMSDDDIYRLIHR